MSDSNCCNQKTRTVAAYLVGGIGVFLILGGLAYLVAGQTVPGVDSARAALRAKYRSEMEAAAKPILTGYSLDPDALAKGNKVYHVPVDRALEIAAEDFKDPAAGRAKLLKRLEDKLKQQSFE
jgi:hypothetical protein